eukprot:TRINITY_DN21007_c0_g1_i1.p1 TRINITY_DN21007_c0_g1~~TRINITY_DN21007_c0_g1_i1.p1  ORF type:complete len:454 (-),score=77.82 TRINITY_DN21007_c0_g1_i1:15-1376(-)
MEQQEPTYIQTMINKYVKMLKVHPPEVVLQGISIDTQLPTSDPRVSRVQGYAQSLLSGSTEAIPDDITLLFTSKYDRMKDQGLSSERIAYEKYFDDLYGKNKTKAAEDPIHKIPRETPAIAGVSDMVVGDEDEHNARIESLSAVRAQELKAEATRLREIETQKFFEKHNVEEYSGDADSSGGNADNAPLTETDTATALDESFYMRVVKRDEAHVPEVKRSLEYEVSGIDGVNRSCTFREHLPSKIFSFLNVLSKDQCSSLRKLLDFNHDEEAAQHQLLVQAKANHKFLIRTNIRRTFIDLNVARLVWRSIKYYLPAELPDGRKLAGVRTKMNYYRYGPGQFFKTHIDGGYRFTNTGETAWFTFVIYLNDDFEGGSTRFCPLKEHNLPEQEFVPIEGAMLVFQQHGLKHCGVVIESGHKHILQGMVMYGPLRYNQLGLPIGADPEYFLTTNCDC